MPLTVTKFTGVQHMSRMDDINNVVEELQVEMQKFYEKGNKAAGTRARKHLP